MSAALISLGIGLAWAWTMTVLDWDDLNRRHTRHGWPQTNAQWHLPILLVATAIFGWYTWRFFH